MDKKGIILILKNTSEETDLFQVTGNVFDIVSACFVNPQEDEISSIEVNGKCAGIIMPVSYTHLDVYKRQVYPPQTLQNVNNCG